MNRVLTLNRIWHAVGLSSHFAAYTRTVTLAPYTHTAQSHTPRWPIGWFSLLMGANCPGPPHLMLINTVMEHQVNYGRLAHWNFEEFRVAKKDRRGFCRQGHRVARAGESGSTVRDWEVTLNESTRNVLDLRKLLEQNTTRTRWLLRTKLLTPAAPSLGMRPAHCAKVPKLLLSTLTDARCFCIRSATRDMKAHRKFQNLPLGPRTASSKHLCH